MKILFIGSLLFCATVFAEQSCSIDLSNEAARKESVIRLAKQAKQQKQEAELIAKEKGWPTHIEDAEGNVLEIIQIDPETQRPLYNTTHSEETKKESSSTNP